MDAKSELLQLLSEALSLTQSPVNIAWWVKVDEQFEKISPLLDRLRLFRRPFQIETDWHEHGGFLAPTGIIVSVPYVDVASSAWIETERITAADTGPMMLCDSVRLLLIPHLQEWIQYIQQAPDVQKLPQQADQRPRPDFLVPIDDQAADECEPAEDEPKRYIGPKFIASDDPSSKRKDLRTLERRRTLEFFARLEVNRSRSVQPGGQTTEPIIPSEQIDQSRKSTAGRTADATGTQKNKSGKNNRPWDANCQRLAQAYIRQCVKDGSEIPRLAFITEELRKNRSKYPGSKEASTINKAFLANEDDWKPELIKALQERTQMGRTADAKHNASGK